jgi:L-asparaginase
MTESPHRGAVPILTGEKLVEAVPGLGNPDQVEARCLRQVPGAHLQFDDLAHHRR